MAPTRSPGWYGILPGCRTATSPRCCCRPALGERRLASRFGLNPDPSNTGYGHLAGQMEAVRPVERQVFLEYLDSVSGRTRAMLKELGAEDLDRIIDRRWDPPVTLGVRLVSIADDCLQHVGHAACLRGLLGGGRA